MSETPTTGIMLTSGFEITSTEPFDVLAQAVITAYSRRKWLFLRGENATVLVHPDKVFCVRTLPGPENPAL